MDRERIITLTAEVLAARQHLEQVEAQLDAVLMNGSGGHHATAKRIARPSKGLHGSIDSRAAQVLARSGKDMSIDEIHKQLPKVRLESLRAALYRLKKSQTIQRAGYGLYRAAHSAQNI
jgi:hypothetical protein